ncbi:hypothetical protein ACJJTC_004981, partial [Scirpophaga incertulas]
GTLVSEGGRATLPCGAGAGGARGGLGAALRLRAEAATLYDVLARLARPRCAASWPARPAALDDLHRPDILRSLIEDVTTTEYIGVTGKFEWTVEDGAHVRALPLALRQWQNGTAAAPRCHPTASWGTGAFGTVYGGHALLAADRAWTAVAVKTLKANATTEEKLDFLSEAEAMKRFDHENVVRLLGVVTKTEPVCTVMEYMLHGDLKSFLLARRHLAVEGAEEVAPRRLTGMARDAARALAYLARLRYVHRDVAARNCLVSARGQVKLADFGMTRLVFDNDYYRFSRKGMLPVRWMAPESLALGVFSPASDVWRVHTLELPSGIKPQLEALIKSCWRQEARARPAAAALAAWLGGAPRLLAPRAGPAAGLAGPAAGPSRAPARRGDPPSRFVRSSSLLPRNACDAIVLRNSLAYAK